ncbi:hypothetical protein ACLMJK_006569 [Lecanora helva]
MDQLNDPDLLSARATTIVRELAVSCKDKYGIAKACPAVYDTAWVSMISRTVNGTKTWVFPESFQYIVDHQQTNGAWEAYALEIDGILNTLAALLALRKHAAETEVQRSSLPTDIGRRISLAKDSLDVMLQRWNVHETDHIGFELLVPAHLDMLEAYGTRFNFPGRQHLMEVYKQRLSKLDQSSLSGKKGNTLVHSLEAFIGKIDFDGIGHHAVRGCMLASPSSTAAYLMETSTWDDESEAYLRWAIRSGAGNGSGGVAVIVPTTTFDLCWVICNLFEGGFTSEVLGVEHLKTISDELERVLQDQGGLIGFSPGFLVDADDTGKTIATLSQLGRSASADQLVAQFEGEDYFYTFLRERNPSLSTNCHVLKGLLSLTDRAKYASQITKAATYLCDCWWNGTANDKWNITPQYPMMAMSQGLIELLDCWEKGHLPNLPDSLLRDRLPVVLIGILIQALKGQNPDGSWGSTASAEQTAYSVLTLGCIASLPWFKNFRHQLKTAIDKGRDFILRQDSESAKPQYLWIGKVTFGLTFVSQSYVLAALNLTWPTRRLGSRVEKLVDVPAERIRDFSQLYSQLPLFSSTPQWKIQLSVIEGYFFLPYLQRMRLDIFPRWGMQEDKYFEMIPSSWTLPSRLDGAFCSPQNLLQQMITSVLIYQVDEYFERVVGKFLLDHVGGIKEAIELALTELGTHRNVPMSNSDGTPKSHELDDGSAPESQTKDFSSPRDLSTSPTSLQDVRKTLKCFITRILQNEKVSKASRYDQEYLRGELRAFLLSHLISIEENARLSKQISLSDGLTLDSPPGSFFEWVRTTGASHVGCRPHFGFLSCLIAQSPFECFPTVEEKYFAQDLNLHLATMSRMLNDYGSLARDKIDTNLNSVNFPDFCTDNDGSRSQGDDEIQTQNDLELNRKSKLLVLAEYERDCYKKALSHLADKLDKRVMKALTAFCYTAELYGQLYVIKDMSSRMNQDG